MLVYTFYSLNTLLTSWQNSDARLHTLLLTPMAVGIALTKQVSKTFADITLYRSTINAL